MALHKQGAGRRLAAARDAVGLTQQDAAEAVGVDRRTIQRYEAGDIGRMSVIQMLADAYDMSVEEMLGGEEFTPTQSRLSVRIDHIENAIGELDRKVTEIRELLVERDEVAQLEDDLDSADAPEDEPGEPPADEAVPGGA